MAQAKLLYVLMAAGELSMSEIARRLGVTVSTASGAVDHLVGLGSSRDSDDPTNRRQVRVSMTPPACRPSSRSASSAPRQLRALFALVSDEDLAVIERAIRIMPMPSSGRPRPP